MLQTDLRYQVIVECLRFIRRDPYHAHHAASIILAIAGEWQDINWGGLYVAIMDASEREGPAREWRPISVAASAASLTDVYVLALSVLTKMGRCDRDEMPLINDRARALAYRMRRPVRPNLPSCCIWRTGMHHCARAAHICSVFGRSSACALEHVLVHAFAQPMPGRAKPSKRSDEAIGMELRASMDSVCVADVVSDMIMLQGWLFSAHEYDQISEAVGSLLWPDFSKYVLLANATHNCTMTFVPVSYSDSMAVMKHSDTWFVQPHCRSWLRTAFLALVLEQMADETIAARSQMLVGGKLDHGMLAAWALTAVHPFADGGLRRLVGDAIQAAPVEAFDGVTTFDVHVVDVFGICMRIPEMHSTTDRGSHAFVEDLKSFMMRFRPGIISFRPNN